MRKIILTFAALVVVFLLLFRLARFRLVGYGLGAEFILVGIVLTAFVAGAILARQRDRESISERSFNPITEPAVELSAREREVLELIAEGLTNQEIGDRLFLAETTIKTHVSNLLRKLEAKRRTQAVQRARSLGILSE